jgi:acetyl-CoA C-acetyltransferase
LIEKGITTMDGILPVNPSGGVLSAHAVLVAGMARIIEAALQIRGQAGARQINDVNTALAHGINGPCGQSHCVWVMSSQKGGR